MAQHCTRDPGPAARHVTISPAADEASPSPFKNRLERPIFIISSPRSGSTLLFETLAQAPGLYTVGGESHRLIEGIAAFSPATRGWHSNRLTAEDASPGATETLARSFYERLRDRDGHAPQRSARMLEKTPKNALRVPFFNAAWPDATFLYLYRDARQTMASMIEAWRSGSFRTYPRLPGWRGDPWSLLLVPGWQSLNGRPLPEIVAQQWKTTTEMLLDDLASLPAKRIRAVAYDDFLASPQTTIESLAASLDLGWDRALDSNLPLSKYTLSMPAVEKWRAMEEVIEAIWPIVRDTDAAARSFAKSLQT
jgi:hypothetical protein